MRKSVKAKLTLETAKKLYAEGGAGKSFALDNFLKEELTEPDWPKSWKDLEKISGAYLDTFSNITTLGCPSTEIIEETKKLAASGAHAKSMRAFAMLSQLAAEMNGEVGWEDWDNSCQCKWIVEHFRREFIVQCYWVERKRIVFKTKQMAKFSLKHHRELWEDYWMILN